MSAAKQLFLVGPGYIGGEILDLLLQEDYEVTVLARRQEAADELIKLGAKVVKGSLSNLDVITRQASLSDIVIHTATADDLPSVEAILQGIAQGSQSASSPPIYIHTSGASLLGDASVGMFATQKVYEDDKLQDIDAISDEAPHRKIDLAIVRAGKMFGSKAKLAIMIPPLIYGINFREKRLSIQLPTLVRFAVKHGYAGHVGDGLSRWSQVHVSDLARGYITLLHALENNQVETVENPYFFCNNGEDLPWRTCVEEIGRLLFQAGKIESPETRPIPRELYSDLFGVYSPVVVGSNSLNRANRLRDLGWKPMEKNTLASLSEEVAVILKETKAFSGYAAPVASGAMEAQV
jgi:nucleoside-diphosphate-sugar epimerase